MRLAKVRPHRFDIEGGRGADRIGTLDNPIIVKSAGEEQYAGCTGYPVDSHVVIWLAVCFPSSTNKA